MGGADLQRSKWDRIPAGCMTNPASFAGVAAAAGKAWGNIGHEAASGCRTGQRGAEREPKLRQSFAAAQRKHARQRQVWPGT